MPKQVLKPWKDVCILWDEIKTKVVKSSDHSWLLRRYFRFSGGGLAKRYRRMMKQF
jgi:hypothetical protein